jgi:hypothetical protein
MIQRTRLASVSSGALFAGSVSRQNAGHESKLIRKTTLGYLFELQLRRRSRRFRNGLSLSEIAVFDVTFVGIRGFTCLDACDVLWVHDDSFMYIARANLEMARHYVVYRRKMTLGKHLDDETFINSNFPGNLRRGGANVSY